jgi:hypothetical protein
MYLDPNFVPSQHDLRLYSVSALAQKLGVRKSELRQRLVEFEVPQYFVGKFPRYKIDEVMDAIRVDYSEW